MNSFAAMPHAPAAYRPAFAAAHAPISTFDELKDELREETSESTINPARMAYLKASIKLAPVMDSFPPEQQEAVYKLLWGMQRETDPKQLALKCASVDALAKFNSLSESQFAQVEKILAAMNSTTDPVQFALLQANLDVALSMASLTQVQLDMAGSLIQDMNQHIYTTPARAAVDRAALDVVLATNSLSEEQLAQARKTLQAMARSPELLTIAKGQVSIALLLNEDSMTASDIGHVQGTMLAMSYLDEPDELEDAWLRALVFIFAASR